MQGYYEYQIKGKKLFETTRIYTDGSFKNQLHKGTFGCILTDTTKGITIKRSGMVNSELNWINSRVCEMYAIINGIELAIKEGFRSALVYSDCYECACIAMNGKCGAKEKEWFINKINELEKKCSITIINISRGHDMIKAAHNECQNAYLLN